MSKKAANADEKRYMGRVVALGCIICRKFRFVFSPCEVHHARTGTGAGQRSSHYMTMGLCPHDHRSSNEALHVMGRKAWEKKWGVTELDLAMETRDELAAYIPEGA